MKAGDTKIDTLSIDDSLFVDDIMPFVDDLEIIPKGKPNYPKLGNNTDDRDEWKQKKRRANRLKRKKKDKYRRDRRD